MLLAQEEDDSTSSSEDEQVDMFGQPLDMGNGNSNDRSRMTKAQVGR